MTDRRPTLVALLSRFWLGVAGGAAVGFLIFGRDLLRPDKPAFQCLTIGALMAGIIGLVRMARPGQALIIVCVFGMIQMGLVGSVGWVVALSGWVLGFGIFIVAIIYDLLARRDVFFGKFLVVGFLMAGVQLAVAPMTEFRTLSMTQPVQVILYQMFVGLVTGLGVGLGIEAIDLIEWAGRAGRTAEDAPETPGRLAEERRRLRPGSGTESPGSVSD